MGGGELEENWERNQWRTVGAEGRKWRCGM